MIVITGAFGFIGSAILHQLKNLGYRDFLVVDNLSNGEKFKNLVGIDFEKYFEKDSFINNIVEIYKKYEFTHIIHMGACSNTTEWDGNYLMRNNFDYSVKALNFCEKYKIPFIYASSASVYGNGANGFSEDTSETRPLNMYAYSKGLFDNYVSKRGKLNLDSQVVGLRFFNVFGHGEQHKGNMASVLYNWNQSIISDKVIKIFGASHGFKPGEQSRDFISVHDTVSVVTWFLQNNSISGIYNVGTGKSTSFNYIAKLIKNWHRDQREISPRVEFIDFPKKLITNYQAYTCSDTRKLRAAGFTKEFEDIETAVFDYLKLINQ